MENNTYIHSTAVVKDSLLHEGAKVYKECFVLRSQMERGSQIGDFSRMEDSVLDNGVKIQRNNLIYGSKIGRHTYTGRNTTIWHAEIGCFCSISWNVSIGGADHDYERVTTHAMLYSPEFGFCGTPNEGYDRFDNNCLIGNDVWLASNVVICRGVTVGNGAVIGAGAIVTKDVPPYSIVVGVPAKIIKTRFPTEIINRLEKLEWWNFPDNIIKENLNLFKQKLDDNIIKKLENIKQSL